MIASAKTIADHYDRELRICWEPSNGFDHTQFNDLFQNKFDFIDAAAFRAAGKPMEFDFYTTPEDVAKLHAADAMVIETCVNMIWRFMHKDLYRKYLENLRALTPVQMAQDIADHHVRHLFKSNPVGLHIRRGDATHANFRVSSDDAFIQTIRQQLAINENLKFFLATDSAATLSTFRGIFGNRIIYIEKEFVESVLTKPKANQPAAFLEWLLLSRCRRVIGTNWSSFSETAAEYGNKELIIAKLTKVKAPPDHVIARP